MKKLSRILWGIALIGVGAALVLRVYGVINFSIFDEGWWTLGIIIPCFITLITEKRKVFSLIGIAIGLVLLSGFRGLISFERLSQLIIPVAVIIFGILLVFKDVFKRKTKASIKQLKTEGFPHKQSFAVFTGQKVAYPGEGFYGADLTTVFGGIECDLRDTVIVSDVLINATCFCSGIDIFVPEDVNVEFCSLPLFGSVSNKTKRQFKSGRPTVFVNGVCIFGGVDIK